MWAGNKIRFYFLLVASLPLLASCGNEVLGFKAATVIMGATAHGLFSDPAVNLKEKNYAAADLLQSKIKDKVSPYKTILAQPLEEVDHPGISSEFGLAIPEGVGLRLQELGYNVLLHDVVPYGNQSLYPKPVNPVNVDFVLRGSYAVKIKDVDVFLRIIDTKTQRVVGGFDYTIPLSREIKKMATTEPRVFRVKK